MEWIFQVEGWIAFLTLTALEIILGVDNIIFISILSEKLPVKLQKRARMLGIAMAAISRIALLFSISLLMRLTVPLFTILTQAISGRDIILVVGGLFLLGKSTLEIHHSIEHTESEHKASPKMASFAGIIVQIVMLDIIFSLDSVITAVGMVDNLAIMVSAILIAVVFMVIFVGPLSNFVSKRPTLKMLALSFLLLVGVALVAEGFDLHIPRGYIYFAMAFSVFVEILNMKIRPVGLKKKIQG
jgi:predicted tellurium resistance membrane protein TerC